MREAATDTYDPKRLRFSEQHYPAVIRQLSVVFGVDERFFKEAPLEVDKHQAADIILQRPDRDYHFAVRIRELKDWRFRGEMTIRCKNNNFETEATKILAGNATHSFYAWDRGDGRNIFYWSLIGLEGLRAHWGAIHKEYQPNRDGGKTGFLYMRLRDLYRFTQPSIILSCASEVRRELEA